MITLIQAGAPIQRPFGSRIDNPGTLFGGNKVMNPESVCGTRLATVSRPRRQ
jgi:hypothetical protein